MDRKLTGSAGEHLVCGVLAQHGWVPALTREGIARTDVLAVSEASAKTISIQVKTTWCREGQIAKWQLGSKDILPAKSMTEWYVLVKMEGDAPARCRYFVLPRDHLAAATWIVHQNWLTDPDIAPGRRNTTVSRAIVDETVFVRYEEKWGLLGEATNDVAVLLPELCRTFALEERVGLPPDHPWHKSLPQW